MRQTSFVGILPISLYTEVSDLDQVLDLDRDLLSEFQLPDSSFPGLRPGPGLRVFTNYQSLITGQLFLVLVSIVFVFPSASHRQGPVAANSGNPDKENDGRSDNGTDVHTDTCAVKEIEDYAPDDARGGVDLLLKNKGYMVGKYVPNKSTRCCRHNTRHNCDQESGLENKGFPCTDDQKRGQAQGVEVEEGAVEEIQGVMEKKDGQGEYDRNVEVVLVPEAEGGYVAQEDVPQGAAASGGDQAQDNHPEQVHAPLHSGEGAGDGKGGGTEKIEGVQEAHGLILA